MTRSRLRSPSALPRKRKALVLFVVFALGGAAAYGLARAREAAHPCAEPAELPVPRARVVACAERYVKDQWYTGRWGKIGSVEADPHGHGSWLELTTTRRNSLRPELDALCTHPRDLKGALGHIAVFEPTDAKLPCRVFSITPLLTVTLKEQSCESLRREAACLQREAALISP